MSKSICPECGEQQFWDGFGDCDACGYDENFVRVSGGYLDRLEAIAVWAETAVKVLKYYSTAKSRKAKQVLEAYPGN